MPWNWWIAGTIGLVLLVVSFVAWCCLKMSDLAEPIEFPWDEESTSGVE